MLHLSPTIPRFRQVWYISCMPNLCFGSSFKVPLMPHTQTSTIQWRIHSTVLLPGPVVHQATLLCLHSGSIHPSLFLWVAFWYFSPFKSYMASKLDASHHAFPVFSQHLMPLHIWYSYNIKMFRQLNIPQVRVYFPHTEQNFLYIYIFFLHSVHRSSVMLFFSCLCPYIVVWSYPS